MSSTTAVAATDATTDARPNALFLRSAALGGVVAYAVGWAVHFLYLASSEHLGHTGQEITLRLSNLTPAGFAALASHSGLTGRHGASGHVGHQVDPVLHYLRDTTLSVPVIVAVTLLAAMAVRRIAASKGIDEDSVKARLGFAAAAAIGAALASAPLTLALNLQFDEQIASLGSHLTGVALATLRYTFAITLAAALLFGVPWKGMERDSHDQQA